MTSDRPGVSRCAGGSSRAGSPRGRVQPADTDDFAALPGDLQRRAIKRQRRIVLTVEDVPVIAQSDLPPTRLPRLRVVIARIDAWWLLDADETGRSSLSAWSDSGDDTPA
jgi:hypothetical protein